MGAGFPALVQPPSFAWALLPQKAERRVEGAESRRSWAHGGGRGGGGCWGEWGTERACERAGSRLDCVSPDSLVSHRHGHRRGVAKDRPYGPARSEASVDRKEVGKRNAWSRERPPGPQSTWKTSVQGHLQWTRWVTRGIPPQRCRGQQVGSIGGPQAAAPLPGSGKRALGPGPARHSL